MDQDSPAEPRFTLADTLHPAAARALRVAERVGLVAAIAAAVLHHGLLSVTSVLHWELGSVSIAVMVFSTISIGLRYRWSRARRTFRRTQWSPFAVTVAWVAAVLAVLAMWPLEISWGGVPLSDPRALLAISEACVLLRTLGSLASITRGAVVGGTNPALVLVSSFAALVLVGTLLLMLPRARSHSPVSAAAHGAPVLTALFTATSASCVTGLSVVPTGTYWSRTGEVIILCLIQFGGLGIMTFGSFFALAGGQNLSMRHSATLSEMMESEGLRTVRRLLLAVVLFTVVCEGVGAALLSGLWPDLPAGERNYYCVFHSVSAFCNAGFSLTPDSFKGMAMRWQVSGVLAGLIVLGGLGFAVQYNLLLVLRSRTSGRHPFRPGQAPVRLSLTSRLVLITTAVLLVGGAIGYYLLESEPGPEDVGAFEHVCDAWFQSVTFRTAGFHTVDHAELQPATKLLAIILMFIGASPGSTGGGIKTICFALGVLSVVSILRGRPRVEFAGRTVPDVLVHRALAIIALGVAALMATTLLLVVFEARQDRFLSHLYEAASALGTVGVSTGITAELTAPSKLVLIVVMFLGRVGPLTLLMALAGRASNAHFEYPTERVTLG